MAILHSRNIPSFCFALLALYLLWLAPDQIYGIDSGIAGSAILLGTAWLTLWLWWGVRDLAAEYASLSQQLAGIGLVFSTAIGISFAMRLHASDWTLDATAASTWQMGRNVLLMLILWPVSAAVLRGLRRDEGIEDERDRAVAARAAAHGYTVLGIALVVLIVQLGFGGVEFQALATPLSIAHWLIGLLILATIGEHLSATLQYRRDQP